MWVKLRVAWRLLAVALWLFSGAFLALFFLRLDGQRAYAAFQLKLVRWWSNRLLRILGVSLSVRGQLQAAPVWVANHVSWLDILVLMAVSPSRFLSKAEVAGWPLIGWLAQRVGTVFIRRGSGETDATTHQLRQLIVLGDRVLFFPEGTSTAGSPVRFHARLFSLPLSMGVSVAPIALIYHDGQVMPRSDLAYIGEQSFMQNLLHLVAQQGIMAEVNLLPAIETEGLTRNQLAQQAEASVYAGWLEMTHKP